MRLETVRTEGHSTYVLMYYVVTCKYYNNDPVLPLNVVHIISVKPMVSAE